MNSLEKHAGQAFIEAKLEQHPNIKGMFDVIGGVLDFFFGGHIFVWIVNKLIMTAGRVAESVLLLGTLWITTELVAGQVINQWIIALPGVNAAFPTNLTTLCIMAFSLIPEVILLSSIVTTFKRWWITFHQDSWPARIGWGVWAGLYTLPTLAFIGLVYVTFHKLTSVKSVDDIVQAGTDTIMLRVCAGWFYSVVEMLYPRVMKTVLELQKPERVVVHVAQTVVNEPLDVATLKASIIDELKPVLAASLPQHEPLDIEQLVQKLVPLVAQPASYEPLDYDKLATSLAPHFAGQMRTMRATIIEEVKSVVPQIASPVQSVDSGKKVAQKLVKKASAEDTEATIEARLESALQKMISQGKKPTIRGLATATNTYRAKVTGWLKDHHPEYSDGKSSGSNGSNEPLSEDEMIGSPVDDEPGDNTENEPHYEPLSEDLSQSDLGHSTDELPVVEVVEAA